MKTNDNCWFQFCFLITLVTICVLSFTSKAQSNRQWSTYYGGSSYEYAYGVATDDAGNVYITGETQSNYGITTGAYGAYQSAFGGAADAFLVKFNAAGVRIWATYYGGAQIDRANSIAIDPDGNIYLAGSTNSSSGIASPGVMGAGGAFQPSLSGSTDAFLLKLDAAGNRLWSTYYGGNGDDVANSVSCDAAGNVCIGGITQSFSGIASNGAYQTAHGLAGLDAFLVKFDKDGNRLWGTYFGGPGHDWGYGVSNDALGNIYLTGVTASITGIAFNGSQMTSGGGGADAFLVKFDASGARQWATYYGGSGYDFGNNKVATDAQNNVYLFGGTSSANGIAFNGFQMTFGGVTDGFLAKFNASGTRLWATYFGGPATEEAFSIAISNFGGIFINGDTYSSTGIASGGFQNSLIGSENQFIANFNSDGNRICSTYYGSVHEEDGSIATDNTGHVFLLANTYSNGGLASGGFQNSFAGARDAFLVKFSTCTNACCSAYGSSNVCDNDDITSVTFANVTTTTPSFYNPGQTCLPGYTNLSDNPVYSPDVYTFVPGCTYAFTAGIGLTAGSTYQV